MTLSLEHYAKRLLEQNIDGLELFTRSDKELRELLHPPASPASYEAALKRLTALREKGVGAGLLALEPPVRASEPPATNAEGCEAQPLKPRSKGREQEESSIGSRPSRNPTGEGSKLTPTIEEMEQGSQGASSATACLIS
ncbi:unnamed protein product [Chrysoparadoxa australica]